jgi:hypothetical protein
MKFSECNHDDPRADPKRRQLVCEKCGATLPDGKFKWTPPPVKANVFDVPTKPDPVNHPSHYTSHPSGIEAIQVCEHFPFSIGNVIKYLWRSGLKGNAIEDLKKARWYLDREITRREQEVKNGD